MFESKESRYNGWANYETWNCALWILNDETLYRCAVNWVKYHKQARGRITAVDARALIRLIFPNGTPDTRDLGKVSYGEIARMLAELDS